MCGIIGYFDYDQGGFNIQPEKWRRIVHLLKHRGPDATGIYQEQGLGFGHLRLSIIDTRKEANQPMVSDDGTVRVTYNGEIYNFKELRKELRNFGYNFKSFSDTEVLICAYQHWGVSCLDKLNGMFAFALYDEREKRLWLVRDFMGVKPLFYSVRNGIIYFASEPLAILSFPDFPSDYDPLGIDSYFTFSYIPAPLTGYKHIKQLLPGQYILCKKGHVSFKKYWDIPITTAKESFGQSEAVEAFDDVFSAAVSRQMVGDVPMGAFLSGGTDSFAILRAMKRLDHLVKAFSLGFKDCDFDESDQTREAAAALDAELLIKKINVDMNSVVDQIRSHCKDPFADSSSIPTFLLCKMASENVKVVLSGDGADELLAGYPVYKANKYAKIYRLLPHWIREGFIKPLSSLAPDRGGKYTVKEKMTRFIYGSEQNNFRDHSSWRILFTQEMKKKFYNPEFFEEVKDFDPIGLYAENVKYAKSCGCTDLDAYLYADQKFYLPNDMLTKVDRMSMAHGLEVRVPFLDKEVVSFCWKLPDKFKVNNGKTKYILREVIRDLYPEKLNLLPKSGFNMAVIADYNPPLRNRFCHLVYQDDACFFGKYHKFMCKYLVDILSE